LLITDPRAEARSLSPYPFAHPNKWTWLHSTHSDKTPGLNMAIIHSICSLRHNFFVRKMGIMTLIYFIRVLGSLNVNLPVSLFKMVCGTECVLSEWINCHS
jgi:hypothetical protein